MPAGQAAPDRRADPRVPAGLRSLTPRRLSAVDGGRGRRTGRSVTRAVRRAARVTDVTIARAVRHRSSTGPPRLSLGVVHRTQPDDRQPRPWLAWEVPSCPIDDSGRTRTSPRTSESRRTRCARTASTACCHRPISSSGASRSGTRTPSGPGSPAAPATEEGADGGPRPVRTVSRGPRAAFSRSSSGRTPAGPLSCPAACPAACRAACPSGPAHVPGTCAGGFPEISGIPRGV